MRFVSEFARLPLTLDRLQDVSVCGESHLDRLCPKLVRYNRVYDA